MRAMLKMDDIHCASSKHYPMMAMLKRMISTVHHPSTILKRAMLKRMISTVQHPSTILKRAMPKRMISTVHHPGNYPKEGDA